MLAALAGEWTTGEASRYKDCLGVEDLHQGKEDSRNWGSEAWAAV